MEKSRNGEVNRNKIELEAEIIENVELSAKGIFRMILSGPFSKDIVPGQFINISIPGYFLRRPISVCDYDPCGKLTILYKVVGEGTEYMSRLRPGEKLNVLQKLGNGFDLGMAGKRPLLIGGGIGIAPLYGLAKKLVEEASAKNNGEKACKTEASAKNNSEEACETEERQVTVILGLNTASEIFYKEEFEKLGCRVICATADGSYGQKGFVTDCAEEAGEFSYYYSCGPLPMFRAVLKTFGTCGEISMEARMGCGFGACVGCSVQTSEGPGKVCADGPVFKAELLDGRL